MAKALPAAAPVAAPGSHPAMAPRWGEPNRVYVTQDARGVRHTVQADADGVVWPSDPMHVRVCDELGLPLTIDPKPARATAGQDQPVDPAEGD